ncbi:centrosome and spindle pole-associated protein 1 [Melanotaenia boesemani]|uniref:centrosome and spindle pole-associated protein 1 n=1 Tax=Melanotaenia boesemani TaxID=1250792 RepID=UPI001C04A273|nr:centrosome and spindle pole-associated protein 1 [Melanotaenia boesemani]
MPPASRAHEMTPNADIGLGLTLVLGADYEKKKQKLLQELQLDYKDHVAKERLREERKKEYNFFLQGQSQTRTLKRGTTPVTTKPELVQSHAVNVTSQGPPLALLSTHTNISPPHTEHLASKRDVATMTEVADKGRSRRTWNQSSQRQRRWKIHMPKKPHSSEEMDTDEEEDFDFRHRRRQDRRSEKPKNKEEKKSRERRMNRAFQDITEMPLKREAPVVHDQIHSNSIWKSNKQMAENKRTTVRTEFATGLLIGAIEDQTVTQMRKEQYKQELLRQIAEQQKNKMKEKKLELMVGVTGITDHEKESDRTKQPRTAYQQCDSLRRFQVDLEAVVKDSNPGLKDKKPLLNTEQRAPLRKSQMDFSTALTHLPRKTVDESGMVSLPGVPPLDYLSEDYHRNFTRLLGEVALPRLAGVAPPLPPIVPNTYKTPYDAARNPLDPEPQNQKALPGEVQQSEHFEIPPQQPLPLRANSQDKASSSSVEGLCVDKSKSRSQLSYQEALKQQIKERDMHKKREKEEEEQLEMKLKAEMMTYNPWGRSGGGAPIRNQNGNLVSDLNQMHRINNNNNMSTLEVTAGSPICCDDQSPSQQLLAQLRYKEDLKQQMEENARKRAEEQERIRIKEEKEEKRLAEERARIQQEYEEELQKQKRMMNKFQIQEPKTHLTAKAKFVKQNKDMLPQSARTRGEKSSQLVYERAPSPPIPSLQKKQKNLVTSRPSSVVSQLSCTEHSVSAPHSQPLPTRLPPLNKGQQEVIKELSTLRRYLRKEQRKLALQRGLRNPGETYPSPPNSRQPRVDAFGSAKKKAVQSSARSLYPAAHFDKQNIRDFNQLEYRDANCVDACEEWIYQQGSPQSTRKHQERIASLMRLTCEEVHNCEDQRQLVSDVTESHDP